VTSGVAQTQAETNEMASTAAKFDQASADLTSTLNKLMANLSMLSSTWKGAAATEFHHVKERYELNVKDLNQALSGTAEAIRASGVGYTTSDTEAAARMSKSGGGDYTLPL
jgi:WXG100 family type VII secretion target